MRIRAPFAISGTYLAVGFLYILFSDRFVLSISTDPTALAQLQTYKGWAYIVVTTVLLFAMVSVYSSRKNAVVRMLRVRERELKALVAEKDAMMREINHRVKNSYQTVISVLRLSSGVAEDARSRHDMMERAIDRIQTIALAHEQVYSEGSVVGVDGRHYLRSVVVAHVTGYRVPRFAFDLELEPVRLTLDQAISCGVIAGELVSNAVAHGFATGDWSERHEHVAVTLRRDGQSVVLQVEDNGVGFDQDSQIAGVGLALVEAMTDTIGGTVKLVSSATGTMTTIAFPVDAGLEQDEEEP